MMPGDRDNEQIYFFKGGGKHLGVTFVIMVTERIPRFSFERPHTEKIFL